MSDAAKIDMRTIEQLKDLVDDEDPDFFTEIVQGYIKTTEVSIKELLEAIKAGDVAKVASTAHCLKGSSGNIGAVRLQELSCELEKSCRNADLAGAPQLLASLEQEFSKVAVVLEKEIYTLV